jgi:hypothetical protein
MIDLTRLGLHYGTDKALYHGFTDFYHEHLAAMRDTATAVLEIGVWKGQSLRMWRDYFPHATVYGIDNAPSPPSLARDGFVIAMCDSGSSAQLRRVLADWGHPVFDLVVDDGGHMMREQFNALDTLWPHVRPGGAYILEDLHTSLDPVAWGGRAGSPTPLDYVRLLASGKADLAGLAEAHVFETRAGQSITSLMRKATA